MPKDPLTPVTTEEAKAALDLGKGYLELKELMLDDLLKTGFSDQKEPPNKEPSMAGGLSRKSEQDLEELYDRYVAFYDFLSDEITRLEVHFRTTKERANTIQAHLILLAKDKPGLTSGELRKAWVQVHPAYQQALKDHLYFRQMLAAHERRLHKMGKAMEKVYWARWGKINAPQSSYKPTSTNREWAKYKEQPFRRISGGK